MTGIPDPKSAQVWPQPGQKQRAATILQQYGLRVLDTESATISADGPAVQWDALVEQLKINDHLQRIIREIAFIEAPRWH